MLTQWKTFLLIIGLCLPVLALAQLTRVEGQPGYWTLGFNGGFSYQSSDVRTTDQGFGFGATLAKNLYYQTGAAFSFDLRGRLLFARQYGLDGEPSFDLDRNDALNGALGLDYLNYPSSLNVDRSFVFQNHRTDVFELGLEGVLTFNRLRERTGLVLSLFGGVGLDWYRALLDQADAAGNEYYESYAALSENADKNNVRQELRDAILDGNYETLAEGYEDFGALGFMPSLGIEVGYDLYRNFSIFVGHRLTFSGTDLLDGHQWKESNNDIYHYTHFGLRWKIYPREAREALVAPEIDVTRPYIDPYRTGDPRDGFVRADVRHVRSQSDMTCRLNGREIPFDYSYGVFEAEFPLQTGRNEIQLTARNDAGSASRTVVIILEEKVAPPPEAAGPSIVITDPPYPDFVTREEYFPVRAVIEKVYDRDNIDFYLNGQPAGFDFNITNGGFAAEVPLAEGRNEIRIVARNEDGQSEQISSIIREAVMPPPSVRFQRPTEDYTETPETTAPVVAVAGGIDGRDQVSLSINGQPVENFSYDPGSGRVEANLPLQQGNNTVEVFVRNQGGTASDRVSIVRRSAQQQTPRPTVDIQTPAQNRVSTFNPSGNVTAQVRYVAGRQDITVEINGQRTNNFTYNNGVVQVSAPFRLGDNEVRIIAYNQSGSDSDAVYIMREREAAPAALPSVYIRTPRDRSETLQSEIDLRAETRNVNRKGDIAFYINGRRSYGFDFRAYDGEIRARVPLEPGANQIRIQVRNPDGADEASVSVLYRQPMPPTVRIVRPANGANVETSEVRVQALAQHVDRMNQIGFYVNGRRITRFDFSGARGEIAADVSLRTGRNTIRITAGNTDGRAEDQVEVFYESRQAPTVRITNPPSANAESTEAAYALRALTTGVGRREDIRLTVNGQGDNRFSWERRTGELQLPLQLTEGENTVRIQVRNETGRDEASTTVVYQKPQLPVITIESPANNAVTRENRIALRARIEHVDSKRDIVLQINGRYRTDFAWNGEMLTLEIGNLREGENQIAITANNPYGRDSGKRTVRYEPVSISTPEVRIQSVSNPVIDFNNPQYGLVSLVASIENVESAGQLTLTVNGEKITDFTYNAAQKNFEANLLLKRSITNKIVLRAVNEAGAAEDSREVQF